VNSWGFDKGFWNKTNKELLSKATGTLVLPKKGKCNKAENEEEHRPKFLKFRNKHSTVESNINELEHCGLNRFPDKGYEHFKRYIGLAVCAFNLKKIGGHLISQKQLEVSLVRQAA
jgi:transposase, IS5 family